MKNCVISNNLTVSGVLQSPLTSLIGVSISNVDLHANTGATGAVWGATGTNRTINIDSNILINASNANNSFLQFKCAGNSGSATTLFGELNNADPFIRGANSSSVMRFQNSGSTDLMTLDNSGNCVHAGNMNCVNVVASGTGSFGTLVGDTTIKNGTSNTSFKIQGSTVIRRFEVQTGGDLYTWNESNVEMWHLASDKQSWCVARSRL